MHEPCRAQAGAPGGGRAATGAAAENSGAVRNPAGAAGVAIRTCAPATADVAAGDASSAGADAGCASAGAGTGGPQLCDICGCTCIPGMHGAEAEARCARCAGVLRVVCLAGGSEGHVREAQQEVGHGVGEYDLLTAAMRRLQKRGATAAHSYAGASLGPACSSVHPEARHGLGACMPVRMMTRAARARLERHADGRTVHDAPEAAAAGAGGGARAAQDRSGADRPCMSVDTAHVRPSPSPQRGAASAAGGSLGRCGTSPKPAAVSEDREAGGGAVRASPRVRRRSASATREDRSEDRGVACVEDECCRWESDGAAAVRTASAPAAAKPRHTSALEKVLLEAAAAQAQANRVVRDGFAGQCESRGCSFGGGSVEGFAVAGEGTRWGGDDIFGDDCDGVELDASGALLGLEACEGDLLMSSYDMDMSLWSPAACMDAVHGLQVAGEDAAVHLAEDRSSLAEGGGWGPGVDSMHEAKLPGAIGYDVSMRVSALAWPESKVGWPGGAAYAWDDGTGVKTVYVKHEEGAEAAGEEGGHAAALPADAGDVLVREDIHHPQAVTLNIASELVQADRWRAFTKYHTLAVLHRRVAKCLEVSPSCLLSRVHCALCYVLRAACCVLRALFSVS